MKHFSQVLNQHLVNIVSDLVGVSEQHLLTLKVCGSCSGGGLSRSDWERMLGGGSLGQVGGKSFVEILGGIDAYRFGAWLAEGDIVPTLGSD